MPLRKIVISLIAIWLFGGSVESVQHARNVENNALGRIAIAHKLYMGVVRTIVVDKRKGRRMTVSAYVASVKSCDSDPTRTATMKRPIVGVTVAVSRDKKHMLGKRVWIGHGVGYRKVTDLMGKRWRNKLDVLMNSEAVANKFGVKKGVTVVVL